MSTQRMRRIGAIAALAVTSTLTTLAVGAAPAGADTTQGYACFVPAGGSYETVPVPLTGVGAPDPILGGDTTDFSNISATFGVTPLMASVGIGVSAFDFVTTPGGIGTPDPASGGGDGVNSVSSNGTLKVTASNTTLSGSTTLTGSASRQFFIVWATANPADIQLYIETSSGSWSGSGTTGLTQVPVVPLPISMVPSPLTVTSDGGGSIVLAGALGPLPANPGAAPTILERNAAPLKFNALFGTTGVDLYCWPGQSTGPLNDSGLPGGSAGFAPASSPQAIDTVTVSLPPTAPTCQNEPALSVAAGDPTPLVIDLTNNCTDVNGDLDLSSMTATLDPGMPGSLAATATDGVFEYTAPPSGATATFSFGVDDDLGQSSNSATGSIAVLGNLCNATTGACSLSQVIITPVGGSTLTLEQAGSTVVMVDIASVAGPDGIPGTPDDTPLAAAPLVLNGQPQLAIGQLNQLTITNARGNDASWNVTGQVTAFYDGTIDPVAPSAPDCLASDASTWSNHCIPGDNLGWIPSAAVDHTQVLGDVADVSAGSLRLAPGFLGAPPSAPSGLSTAQLLCTAPVTLSGGTFTCDAGLALSVPASAAAGAYTAVITLTLV